MSRLVVVLLVLGVTLAGAKPKPSPQCGYASCPAVKEGMLNVHLVPHSHDDVGWLKTVDQYYYGSRTDIQNAGVQYILDSVIQELLHDPTKRFIWVETAYLWQWWREQHDLLRHQVKTLVSNGQLEIIGGGWSMPDEAVTHYQSTIDQFTWGFRKLNDTFGSCGRPHIGWQIDPFGHSRETASLMAQMGFDGLFFGRLDYQDKAQRLASKTPEFVWEASQNLGDSAWLFTHVLFNHYSPPPGFCFDLLCDDEPFIDDKKSPDYNVDKKVHEFIEFAEKQSKAYRTDHVIMTMGQDFNYQDAHPWFKNLDKLIRSSSHVMLGWQVDQFEKFVLLQASHYTTHHVLLTMGEDFQYQSAHAYFKNMDKLIRYVNERQKKGDKINVFYSTPSCYLKSVHESNLTWSTKQDDFFPYPSDEHSYWTGYFTSRPTLKYFERLGNNFLQVCKQLYALADLGPEDWADLNAMREAMGIMQHHDAITGTEQQHVAFDYAQRLHKAFDECQFAAETALNKLMQKSDANPPVKMEPCLQLNISQCATSEQSSSFVVTVYNPLARPASPFVRLPVPQHAYKVFCPKGKEVDTQLVPIPPPVLKVPGRDSSATHELVFKATEVPPLGFKIFYVQQQAGIALASPPQMNTIVENQRLRAHVDEATGLLTKITIDGQDTTVDQSFLYYEAAEGNNEEAKNRSSGAYIFRPRTSEAVNLGKAKTTTIKGPLVQELHQQFADWVSQVIRIYNGENHLELQWLVGPVPIEDGMGKEVISRFSTGWATDGVFYTDSNGRETLERRRNFRPTWKVNISEPVSGNYYPVTTHIAIKSKDAMTLSVLPDRAQGGSSVHDGEVELMLHRRLLHDDAFGVGEALNETAFGTGLVASGRHLVLVGPTIGPSGGTSAPAQRRQLAQTHLVMAPWLLLAPTKLTPKQFINTYVTEFSGLKTPLPANVHVLTLEPWKGNSFLLRLEHFLEKTDDPRLSKSVTVHLEDLFSAFSLDSARETTLGGNQWLEQSARMQWQVSSGSNIESNEIPDHSTEPPSPANKFAVTLQPMQIRTFIIHIKLREDNL